MNRIRCVVERITFQSPDTGITRAKKMLVLVGTKKAVAYAVKHITVTKRNTKLKDRLKNA